jgi:hypothetical protein
LSEFIASFGFQPMLSEFPSSFPVDPDATTVENCLVNVRCHADLFVLIVGKRFGTPDATGKSITNLEYSAARAEGVPVFVFVSNEVIAQLPIWKANREKKVDFPGVDSEKLFEFVEALRGQSEKWCFAFDSAQEIQQVLRDQWSSLIASMLDTRRRTRPRLIPRCFAHLSADAQQLMLERPRYWEYSLFAQTLVDGIANLRFRRRDFDLGLSFRTGQHVPSLELSSWASKQMAVAMLIPDNINRLFSGPVMKSFGPPGVAGDPEAIVHVAERTVAAYEKAMEWAEDIRAAIVHERARGYLEAIAQLVGRMLDEFEEFAKRCHATFEEIRKNPPSEGENRQVNLNLKLSVDPKALEALQCEQDSLVQAIMRGEIS